MLYSILVLFIATINWLSAAHPDDLDAPSTRRSVSGAATSIPTLTRQHVIDALTTGVSELYRARVMRAVGAVPADRYQEFVRTCTAFMTPDMSAVDRVQVISALGAVPADIYESVIAATFNLVTRGMRSHDIAQIIRNLSRLRLTPEEIIARAEAVNTRIFEFLNTLGTGITPAQRFALIIELINNPDAPLRPDRFRAIISVTGQESLSAQRQEFYNFYTKVATAPATSAIVDRMLPAPAAPDFAKQISHMNTILGGLKEAKNITASQLFRYNKAIDGLKYLQNARANFNYRDLPNIRQMFGLLFNLCNDQNNKNNYVTRYVKDHANDFAEAFARYLNDPTINKQVATYTDPEQRNLAKISYLLTTDLGKQLIAFMSEDTESPVELTQASLRFLYKCQKEMVINLYNPLIEAMFMSVRGHNLKLDNPEEPNKPACVDGVYLNLIKALSEIEALSADGAASAISSVNVLNCY